MLIQCFWFMWLLYFSSHIFALLSFFFFSFFSLGCVCSPLPLICHLEKFNDSEIVVIFWCPLENEFCSGPEVPTSTSSYPSSSHGTKTFLLMSLLLSFLVQLGFSRYFLVLQLFGSLFPSVFRIYIYIRMKFKHVQQL